MFLLCSQGAKLLKWPREQMDKWGPWFLFWLFYGEAACIDFCCILLGHYLRWLQPPATNGA